MNVGRGSLHVGGHNLGMVAEVLVKGVAIPAFFNLHHIERETPEEVLQCSSYADGVTLDPGEASYCCCL